MASLAPSVADLQALVIAFRDARDWSQFHKPKDVAISLSLEAAEVLEKFQWKTDAEAAAWLSANRGELADELADVLYWILLLANDAKIDLPRALSDKLAKNAMKYPLSKAKGSKKKYTELG